MAARSYQFWSDEADTVLRELAEKGFNLRKLALRLRRTEASIKKRVHLLRLDVKPTGRYHFRFK